MSANITVVGNISSDISLAYSPSGHPVANFTVASSSRHQDKTTGEWTDGEPSFIRCSVWRKAAENTAETLQKGSRVVVVGKLRTDTVEAADGTKRTYTEVEAEEVGASLRFATAAVTKNTRTADPAA